MPDLHLPRIEDIDVEDLLTLPEGYRYELHGGNLVIMPPSTFWHQDMVRRLMLMLHQAGLNVFHDPGVLGDLPRDNRLPDVGVVYELPADRPTWSYSNLPGSAFRLVVEVVSDRPANGEYTDKMDWYAQRGIPEYWIADQAPEPSDDDALMLMHRLEFFGGKPRYECERTLLLSELEAEYKARSDPAQ